MGGTLGGGDETCARAHRGGAGGQHGRDAACATDPAGSDDGHSDHVEDRVEQRQQPELTIRVAPGLDPLDDDQIAPGRLGRPCLLAVATCHEASAPPPWIVSTIAGSGSAMNTSTSGALWAASSRHS